jgi:transcriptional regulator with XRE-family HTH domain
VTEPVPLANHREFGHAMARARRAAGLTLDKLAERSGVSRRMLIEIEQGRANPSLKVLHAVVHATGAPIAELWAAACVGHAASG